MSFVEGNCICKICQCGRHKCPHKSLTTEKWGPDICSEYGHEYQGREVCRPVSCKPPYNLVSNDCPLSNVTTNRSDFVPHDVQPIRVTSHQPYEPPTTPMNDQSVYRHEFTEKPHCASRMIKPIIVCQDKGPFQSETTNRTHYIPWNVCPAQARPRDTYKPSEEPFQDTNTYRSDYVAHNQSKVSSCKPPVTAMKSNVPFDGMTEQKQKYIAFPIEQVPKTAKAEYQKPDAPFEDMTTNRHDYVAQGNCKAHSLKPPPHRVESDQPFCSETTNRTDFVSHPSCVPEKHVLELYVKPEGEIDLKTTYNESFVNLPHCKVMPIKQPQPTLCNAPFDGDTSYRQAYKNWDQPPNIIQHRETYSPLLAPFDDKTTMGTSYVAHNAPKAQSCKPPIHSIESQPFDGQSHYRSEYVNKNIPICPAASLTKNNRSVSPDGYSYSGEDDSGHIHYVKQSERGQIPVVFRA